MIKYKHFSREIAMQALYQAFVMDISYGKALDNVFDLIDCMKAEVSEPDFEYTVFKDFLKYWDNTEEKNEICVYAQEIILGIIENKEKMFSFLENNDKTRKASRVDLPVLAILLVALFEIECVSDLDYQISINEALDFCKKYSDDKSKGYMNSVLQAFLDNKGV